MSGGNNQIEEEGGTEQVVRSTHRTEEQSGMMMVEKSTYTLECGRIP